MSSSRRSLLLLEQCKTMRQLKQTHAQIITGGLGQESFALSRLLAFCSHPIHGNLSYAQLLFQHIQNPTLCIRNTMIKAFLHKENYTRPLEIYHSLLHDGLYPDNYTLPYVLKACANLWDIRTGSGVHTHVVKLGFCADIFVSNTLVSMYMSCGNARVAREVFDGSPQRNAATWTIMISGYSKLGEVAAARQVFNDAPGKDRGIWGSMVSGYVQNNCFKEGLLMFRLMQAEGLEPDEGVIVSALCACAQLGAIDLGSWIHRYLNLVGLPLSIRLGTALIDMYVKCGNLELAKKLFDRMQKRDTICWNVMILGLAMHGDGEGAVEFFHSMQKEGLRPDDATFIAILAACSHAGLVEEGLNLFNRMKTSYYIEPRSEHYGCVVDFLGRAGRFEEAKEIIERIPSLSSPTERAVAWRALLSACWNHGETKLAEMAAEHLLQLEVHSGVYVLLSNIYENYGKNDYARRLRKSMKDGGVPKSPGCSSIELGGCVHEFVAGEQMHPQMEEVHRVLERLNDQQTCPDC
ncbi:pentatricopeptide repeat-containing protein At5g66520-like [Phoenix dactylifera]|uniref:Pentatricopeptide repeat-containing protein At5g66520-like n=1 Tax=Phoenix dactylifera TaxID=42345 RepID=A0A8B8ZEY6_PHODC|nr:pentatricopeptide repeat-containing protein At5g66520-like [Phoenix dactylifera]XP_038972695.1 pentatricopeptide repeat-containing protein At5g66520-like [Phoenix dactylifera]